MKFKNRIEPMHELKLLSIDKVLAAASHKYNDTEVIATILHSNNRYQENLIHVDWSQGTHPDLCSFNANLVERVFNKYCTDDFNRKFIVRIWISPGENTLACAFNATMLAILDAGISISGILSTVEDNEVLFVYDRNDKCIFYQNFGPVNFTTELVPEVNEIKRKIIFEIENKYQFKL